MPVHFRRLITLQIKVWARMKDVWNSYVFLCLKWYISVVQITEPKCEVLVYYFQQDWYLNAVRHEVRHPPPSSQNISTQGLVMIPNIFKWLGWIFFFKWLFPGWLLVSVGVPVARDIIVITKCGAHNGICHQADWCYKALVTANSNTTTAQRAGKNGKSISFHEAPFSRIVFIFIPYFGQSSPSQPGNKCTLSDPFTNLKLLYREDIKTQ